MLVHRLSKRDFRAATKNRERKIKLELTESLYTWPWIDHNETYFQRSSKTKSVTIDNLFVVSYAYKEFGPDLDEWERQMEKAGYQTYAEDCFYGTDVNDCSDSLLIIVAESKVNLVEALKYIRRNPHPDRYVRFNV